MALVSSDVNITPCILGAYGAGRRAELTTAEADFNPPGFYVWVISETSKDWDESRGKGFHNGPGHTPATECLPVSNTS